MPKPKEKILTPDIDPEEEFTEEELEVLRAQNVRRLRQEKDEKKIRALEAEGKHIVRLLEEAEERKKRERKWTPRERAEKKAEANRLLGRHDEARRGVPKTVTQVRADTATLEKKERELGEKLAPPPGGARKLEVGPPARPAKATEARIREDVGKALKWTQPLATLADDTQRIIDGKMTEGLDELAREGLPRREAPVDEHPIAKLLRDPEAAEKRWWEAEIRKALRENEAEGMRGSLPGRAPPPPPDDLSRLMEQPIAAQVEVPDEMSAGGGALPAFAPRQQDAAIAQAAAQVGAGPPEMGQHEDILYAPGHPGAPVQRGAPMEHGGMSREMIEQAAMSALSGMQTAPTNPGMVHSYKYRPGEGMTYRKMPLAAYEEERREGSPTYMEQNPLATRPAPLPPPLRDISPEYQHPRDPYQAAATGPYREDEEGWDLNWLIGEWLRGGGKL